MINLGGFVQTADQWKVLLAVKTKSGNAATPEDVSYLTMAEGDKDGVVELLKVYPHEEKVDINNSGTPMTLTMKENGFASAPAAPPPGGRAIGLSPAIRPIGSPAAPPQPGMGPIPPPGQAQAPPQTGGGDYNNNNTLVGGGNFNRGAVSTPAVYTGAGVNAGAQQQQTAYQTGGGSSWTGNRVITGGAAPPAVSSPQLPSIPIGQTSGLSHLSQPNSTPPMTQATDVPMPPVPGL